MKILPVSSSSVNQSIPNDSKKKGTSLKSGARGSAVVRNGRAAIPVWKYLLNGRRMILNEREDFDSWLEFATLCRHGGNNALAERVLNMSWNMLSSAPEHAVESGSPALPSSSPFRVHKGMDVLLNAANLAPCFYREEKANFAFMQSSCGSLNEKISSIVRSRVLDPTHGRLRNISRYNHT